MYKHSDKSVKVPHEDIPLYAAFGASTFTRECSRRTFEVQGRAMITNDMLAHINEAYIKTIDPSTL